MRRAPLGLHYPLGTSPIWETLLGRPPLPTFAMAIFVQSAADVSPLAHLPTSTEAFGTVEGVVGTCAASPVALQVLDP